MAPKKAPPAKPAAKVSAKSAAKAAPKAAAPAPPKAAPPKPKPAPSKKAGIGVCVRGLDFEGLCHETVKEAFPQSGKITEVRLRHGKYVLLFYSSADAAQKALEFNGKTVKGCKVTVESLKQATPTRPREEYCSTLFVGELPGGVTKNQIRAHFSSAGKILKVRYYEKQHHGFVYFSNNAEAKKAMALADVPFSFGKDPSTKEVVPLSWQHKLNLQYSLRTKAFDRKKAEKKANRAPPSVQNRRKAKAEERKRRKAKKGSKKTSTTKKASAAKAPKEAVPLPAEKAAPKKAAPKKK
eukprot:TRINITY_DN9752_c0_g2_i1.p1 TRINITY_DN9752_c0_g2~~TRINITY_DN9752_c0_g2_i1.p1  ORF type:complete len:296 (+),score=69.80 TRINITY_DN9752_c0_g2_i1:70-957(+)